VFDLCKKAQEPAGQGIMYVDVEIIIDWIPRREDGLRSRLAEHGSRFDALGVSQ
jgi:hypothetical protein